MAGNTSIVQSVSTKRCFCLGIWRSCSCWGPLGLAAAILVQVDVRVVHIHFVISVVVLHLNDDDLLDLNV